MMVNTPSVPARSRDFSYCFRYETDFGSHPESSG